MWIILCSKTLWPYRRLAVLARSWSCQPRIAGRSVLNLQMWTFARIQRKNEAERTVEIKPELIFGAALLNSEENDETRHLWNLRVWWTESFLCKVLHRLTQVSVWFTMKVEKEGYSPWNWVVNSLCLSADYSGMGLGPKPERICCCPRLSNCEHNSAQTALAPNHWDVLVSKQSWMHEAECLILTDVLL